MLIWSLFFVNREAAASVLIGVLIALANFWLLERLAIGLLGRKKASTTRLVLMFIAKMAILFGVLAFVVLRVPIQPLYFLLGLSCIVVGIVAEGIIGMFSSQVETD